MTFYQKKLQELQGEIYANKRQLKTVIDIKNYIETNYEENLNLALLSHLQYISKYHLIRLFKQYYGVTPRQFLIDKRIEKSKELLKNGTSVTETCFAVGFNSLGSFSTLFKTKTGKSPTEFQKRATFKK